MIEYTISERMNPGHKVTIKNVKVIDTVRVRRIVNGAEMIINADKFDPRLHERVVTTAVDTEVPVPQAPQVRTIPMSRAILEAMTMEELRGLPQFGMLDAPQSMTTKAKLVTALLILCGIEEAEVSVKDAEAEYLANLDTDKPAPKKKSAPKKSAPKISDEG